MPQHTNLGPITTSYWDGPPLAAVNDIAEMLGDGSLDRPWRKMPIPINQVRHCQCRTVLPEPQTRGACVDGEMQWFDYVQCPKCEHVFWRKSNYTCDGEQ